MLSTNCATSDEKKTLTVVDIRAIIETCGCNGVSEISFEGLSVKFHKEEKPISAPVLEPLPEEIETTTTSIIETSKDYEKSIDLEKKADELMNLHLIDPLKYEEVLANPELLSEFEEELDKEL